MKVLLIFMVLYLARMEKNANNNIEIKKNNVSKYFEVMKSTMPEK